MTLHFADARRTIPLSTPAEATPPENSLPVITTKLSKLEARHETLWADHQMLADEVRGDISGRVERLEETAAGLRIMIGEIKAKLESAASREDILGLEVRLGTRIDAGINGLLNKALDSVPESHAININRQLLIWTAILAVTGIVGLIWKQLL